MSAAVLGKRSLFEEAYGSPPLTKRVRCGGGSPIRFPPPAPPFRTSPVDSPGVGSSANLAQGSNDPLTILRQLFTGMDDTLLQKVLESCGNNVDAAIRSLNELRLSSGDPSGAENQPTNEAVEVAQGGKAQGQDATCRAPDGSQAVTEEPTPAHGPAQTLEARDWVELVVREMMTSIDLDDARARAARVLEAFEQAILTRSSGSPARIEILQKEAALLKEHLAKLNQDNSILKKAVAIHHSRQEEHEERGRELEQMKQLLAQYQEQLRSLEMTNYALNVHLKTAQQSSAMPNRFHPDIF